MKRAQERLIALGEAPRETAVRYEGHPRKHNLALLPGFLSEHSQHHNFDYGCYPGHHEYYPCGVGLGSRRGRESPGDGRGIATDAYGVTDYSQLSFRMNHGLGFSSGAQTLVLLDIEELGS